MAAEADRSQPGSAFGERQPQGELKINSRGGGGWGDEGDDYARRQAQQVSGGGEGWGGEEGIR